MKHSVGKLQVFVLLFFGSTVLTTVNFFFCNSLAYASPVSTTYLRVSPLVYVSGTLGETFKIDVDIFNVENLRAFDFKLSYNTTVLDVVQVVQGPFLPPPPESSIDKLEINETRGLVWFSMSLSSSGLSKNGNGTLVSINFNVTFAPELPAIACCVLDLHETILYDNTMTAIVHCLTDGVYFWKCMLDDPDGSLLLDLTTQKGGTGIGEPSPPFSLGEIVELRAHLTYDNVPEENNLVSFEVLDPNDETVVIRSPFTDNNGDATIEFRIARLDKNVGTWKALVIAEVKGKTAWDILYFAVRGPVGGHMAPIGKTYSPTSQLDLYASVLLTIVVLIVVIMKAAKLVRSRQSTRKMDVSSTA